MNIAHVDCAIDNSAIVAMELGPSFFKQGHPNSIIIRTAEAKTATLAWKIVIDDNSLWKAANVERNSIAS